MLDDRDFMEDSSYAVCVDYVSMHGGRYRSYVADAVNGFSPNRSDALLFSEYQANVVKKALTAVGSEWSDNLTYIVEEVL